MLSRTNLNIRSDILRLKKETIQSIILIIKGATILSFGSYNFNYQNNKVESFEINGHAFAGEPGEDLVCAAVSAVTFGLTNSIINLDESELSIKMEDGYLLVENLPSSDACQTLIYGMITSLQTIEEDQFKYLTVIENK